MQLRYTVITNVGTFELWCDSKEAATQKFAQQKPKIKEFEIFIYGEVPDDLPLSTWRHIVDISHSVKQAKYIAWLYSERFE